MLQHAQSELPNECCGILAGVREGDALRVLAWYPLVNEAASPVEYRSDARSMFEATKHMRHHGNDIVAVYHSHPTSAPIPSRTDLERLYSEDVVHFIIGLADPEPRLRGWWLTSSAYDEAAWRIVEG
jgi:proteasome lid subunit RPN8/RPN11